MKKSYHLVCCSLLLSVFIVGCAVNPSFIDYQVTVRQVSKDVPVIDFIKVMNSKDYVLLQEAIESIPIPNKILRSINSDDRIAIVVAERNEDIYKDYLHLIVSSLTNKFILSGFTILDTRSGYPSILYTKEKLASGYNATKIIVVTVYEGGIFYGYKTGGGKSIDMQASDYLWMW